MQVDDQKAIDYKEALVDLVKATAIAVSLGKSLKDYIN